MSRAFSMTTLVGALEAAAEVIGAAPAWEARNEMQAELLRRYGAYRDAIPALPELRGWARRTVEELNAILRDEGVDLVVPSWPPADDRFGMVSIIDIAVSWPQPGVEAPDINGQPAFRLGGDAIDSCWLVDGHEHPVVRLRTRSGDVVAVTVHDEPAGPFELVAAAARLARAVKILPRDYGGVVLPMVDLDIQLDLDWLADLETASPTGPWWVTQALQKVRFGMNQQGARAQEATMLALGGGIPPLDYVFDAPFLVWIEREGVDVPIFQAYVSQEDWRNPGDFARAA